MRVQRIQVTGVMPDHLHGSLSATDWTDRTMAEADWIYVGDEAPAAIRRTGSPCYAAIESQPAEAARASSLPCSASR